VAGPRRGKRQVELFEVGREALEPDFMREMELEKASNKAKICLRKTKKDLLARRR